MDGLPTDTESGGDLLPGPSARSRVADLDYHESFQQPVQRSYGSQPDGWVVASSLPREFRRLIHDATIACCKPSVNLS